MTKASGNKSITFFSEPSKGGAPHSLGTAGPRV